ncbi:Rha family transcriptional regulator [Marinobacter adhaerens]|uniref:Rha family transcriptional regulator n=1 Tax=Marinobacter adhaerens TaxID=1033846 RepID=UPI003BA9F8F4|nr:Rha family transcriptional regulator [Marinobacter adhaerens]
MTIALTSNELIVVQQNQPRTTSLKVAQAFGKRHTHVLDKVQALDCSPEFSSANFSAFDQEITVGKGAKRKSKVYEMTKDGFMFLVMGFTGKKAAQVKEAYINAFNEMAEKLYGNPAQPRRKQKALPNGLSIEQQDAIKGLVKARVDALPPKQKAKAAITCWSSLKSKFGCTYKEIEPEHFSDAVSLVARVPLEGEYLEAAQESAPLSEDQVKQLKCLKKHCEALSKKFSTRMPKSISADNEKLFFELREHVFVISRQCDGLMGQRDFLGMESIDSGPSLTEGDLSVLYAFSVAAMQLVDMGERAKPAINALQPLGLFGLESLLEVCRKAVAHFHDGMGVEMESAAKTYGIKKDYVDFAAAKDRSRPIIINA